MGLIESMKDSGFQVTQVDIGVKHVTLIHGESIIGHVYYSESSKQFTIDKPVFPQMSQNPNGNMGISLLPLRPYIAPDLPEIVVREDHVVYLAPVREDMEKLYRRRVSDILIPDAKDISAIKLT